MQKVLCIYHLDNISSTKYIYPVSRRPLKNNNRLELFIVNPYQNNMIFAKAMTFMAFFLELQGNTAYTHIIYIYMYLKYRKLQPKESQRAKSQGLEPTIGFPDTFPGIHIRNQSLLTMEGTAPMKGAKIFYGGKTATIQMRSLFFGSYYICIYIYTVYL